MKTESNEGPLRVVLASRNAGKARELAALIDDQRIELVAMSEVLPASFDVEETGSTFQENARLKALSVAAATGLLALADDSGLEVDALGGRPGVYSARYSGEGATDASNNQKLLDDLAAAGSGANRGARFRCVLAFAELRALEASAPSETDEAGVQRARVLLTCEGVCEGRIAFAPRGARGFGYDPLFEAEAAPGRTLAELEPAEKNALSHRGAAIAAFRPLLRSWLDTST